MRLPRLTLLPLLLFVICNMVASGQDQRTSPAAQLKYKLEWATFLGGSEADDLREIIILPDGSLLLGGQTVSADFPVTQGALQTKYGGEPAGTGHPGLVGGDCFLARLSPDGTRMIAATYFGGSKQERDVYGMALDSSGNVVITTTTRSPDLPVTEGAFQRKYSGGVNEIMAAKISPDLNKLLWCTYIGGSQDESPRGGLAVDKDDNIYLVGTTTSPDFPTTTGVLQRKVAGNSSAVLLKLKADGSLLLYSTLLGGAGHTGIMGIRVDAMGNAHISGHTDGDCIPATPGAAQPGFAGQSDCFLAGFSPDGSKLLYATYLGGRANEFAEHRQALLDDGSVVLTGVTASDDFPTTAGAFKAKLAGKNSGFVTRLASDGRKFIFSTLLGGSGPGFLLMPTVDAAGNVYVVGTARGADFPVTPGCLQPAYAGDAGDPGGDGGDGVFAILSPDGSKLLYSTFLGGSGQELIRSIAIGKDGAVFLVGKTTSDNFPATSAAFQPKRTGGVDAFVVKLVPQQ